MPEDVKTLIARCHKDESEQEDQRSSRNQAKTQMQQ